MTLLPLLALLAAATAASTATATGTGTSTAPLTLAPAVARPGDAVLVRVRGAGEPAGTLAGRPLHFFRRGDEAWAVAALPLETAPGPARAEVALPGEPAATADLAVVEPGFPSKRLRVAPRFVEPPASAKPRIARDRKAFAAAYDRPFVPPFFVGAFTFPRPEKIHGRFGDQRVFNGRKASVHYGVDLDAPRGAPVNASNDGEVVLARDCYYSGRTVVVWHGADLFTLYFHLDRLLVKPGQKVRRGAVLGKVGSTGRSTGPHLHWSARAAGLLVDPESLAAIDFAAGTAPPRRAGAVEAGGPSLAPDPDLSGSERP